MTIEPPLDVFASACVAAGGGCPGVGNPGNPPGWCGSGCPPCIGPPPGLPPAAAAPDAVKLLLLTESVLPRARVDNIDLLLCQKMNAHQLHILVLFAGFQGLTHGLLIVFRRNGQQNFHQTALADESGQHHLGQIHWLFLVVGLAVAVADSGEKHFDRQSQNRGWHPSGPCPPWLTPLRGLPRLHTPAHRAMSI